MACLRCLPSKGCAKIQDGEFRPSPKPYVGSVMAVTSSSLSGFGP
jgi:hypothetical protein